MRFRTCSVGVVLVAITAGVVAPGAVASVRISAMRIIVSSAGARAVIGRSPLNITFRDAHGRPVLRQAPVGGIGGSAGMNPAPAGVDPLPDAAIYSPFPFEVGGSASPQQPAGLWEGNMLAGGHAGVAFSATRVIGATRTGNAVRLQIATNDPTRTLLATVRPDGPGAIRVDAQLSNPAGVSAIGDAFSSAPGEAFRGFGGRHNSLDQHGHDFYNWVEQENFGAGPFQPVIDLTPGSGGSNYLFPNGATAAYYVQNQFVSSHRYGFFLNSPKLSRWRLDSARPDAWQVTNQGAHLDYTVAVGPPRQDVRTLTRITGRQRVAPRWAIGPMLYRAVQILCSGCESPELYRSDVRSDLRHIEKLHLPVTGYAYEGWASQSDNFLRRFNRRLHARGIHPVGYLRAFVADDTMFDPPGTLRDAIAQDACTTTATGQPYIYAAQGPACLIDFTNPAAVRWWSQRVRHMLNLGFDGFMQDFGEQVQDDMHFANGQTGATMHNRYPVVYHRVTRRIVGRYEHHHPHRSRIFFFTRSGYSGRPGSARYEGANFPGDETTDWEPSTGIASLAKDMLNRSVGGAVGFTTDIGGYIDSYVPNLTKELFIRWSEWAALSPFYRLHNSCCTAGTRMPWSFDHQALRTWTRMAQLHLRARPLILRLWRRSTRTGQPIATPLWLAYPRERQAARQEQEWLLGRDVLVAPVVTEGARSQKVYFPRGCWRRGSVRYRGPGTDTVPAPLGHLPYFERCGEGPF